MDSLFTRIVAGHAGRKSRLHDECGNLVTPSRIIRNAPKAIVTAVVRATFGIREPAPWISYDAREVLARLIDRKTRLLEFGSGLSTEWYARRAGAVISVEDDAAWYARIAPGIAKHKNVTYRFASSADAYVQVDGGPFDIIIIDGSHRLACVESALPHLAGGGLVYLDNSDKSAGGDAGDVPAARKRLEQFAAERRAELTYFTDFAPAQFFAQQGMMVRLPPPGGPTDTTVRRSSPDS